MIEDHNKLASLAKVNVLSYPKEIGLFVLQYASEKDEPIENQNIEKDARKEKSSNLTVHLPSFGLRQRHLRIIRHRF